MRSFHRTHGFAAIVTRCSNNYGPYPFPEKFIPLMILKALGGEPLPIHGDGLYVRDSIHVEDHCRALVQVMDKGEPGEVCNLGGDSPRRDLDVARGILRALGRKPTSLEHVVDRPGRDRRYAIDARKAHREIGWRPRRSFEEGLEETVRWYQANERWWRRILEGR